VRLSASEVVRDVNKPDLARVTIRKPKPPDGAAGEALPDPEVGKIFYYPPIVFCGYYNQPEETRKGISLDPKHQDRQNATDVIGGRDRGKPEAKRKMGCWADIIVSNGFSMIPDRFLICAQEGFLYVFYADGVGVSSWKKSV